MSLKTPQFNRYKLSGKGVEGPPGRPLSDCSFFVQLVFWQLVFCSFLGQKSSFVFRAEVAWILRGQILRGFCVDFAWTHFSGRILRGLLVEVALMKGFTIFECS